MRLPAAILALAASPALAFGPAEVQRYAEARAKLGLPAVDAACLLEGVAQMQGPEAAAALIEITEEGPDRQSAVLRFVNRHGDAWYGIVALCQAGPATTAPAR